MKGSFVLQWGDYKMVCGTVMGLTPHEMVSSMVSSSDYGPLLGALNNTDPLVIVTPKGHQFREVSLEQPTLG